MTAYQLVEAITGDDEDDFDVKSVMHGSACPSEEQLKSAFSVAGFGDASIKEMGDYGLRVVAVYPEDSGLDQFAVEDKYSEVISRFPGLCTPTSVASKPSLLKIDGIERWCWCVYGDVPIKCQAPHPLSASSVSRYFEQAGYLNVACTTAQTINGYWKWHVTGFATDIDHRNSLAEVSRSILHKFGVHGLVRPPAITREPNGYFKFGIYFVGNK